MIVLDTNVMSELMKPRPAARVVAGMATQATASLYTTCGVSVVDPWKP